MYSTVNGEGEPLLLLHGGFSDSRDFDSNLATLPGFRVYRVDRRGHGRTPDIDGPITIDILADDVITFIEETTGPTHLAGYSAGGVVAAAVALKRSDLVRKLVLISTAMSNDGWAFLPDANAEMPPQIVDAYAEVSPDGRAHFPVVQAKFAQAAAEQRALEPSGISSPTLVMASDDDIIHTGHTIEMYHAIPNAQLAIVPGTSHTLLLEKPALCTTLVADFLTDDPKPFMPIRRV
jgi:pimeloyl-ACP methyl ester carboxylesterase